ncbi:MAG: NUDIX domain-containing protein [Planctomycetes bacterium]|nr:NUDIX domain-containing protein [Planctomycetota bacterium]
MSEVALQQDFLGAFGVLEVDGCVLLAANRRALTEGGSRVRTFDLPGGRVEPGERLDEALRREWLEETGTAIESLRFLFVQEGVRSVDDRRRYAWRSFFFEVEVAFEARSAIRREPVPMSEVEGLLWMPSERLGKVLHAPYHAGYLRFRADGQAFQVDTW